MSRNAGKRRTFSGIWPWRFFVMPAVNNVGSDKRKLTATSGYLENVMPKCNWENVMPTCNWQQKALTNYMGANKLD